MREVELKILGIDKNKIVKKLHALGAEKLFDGRLGIAYFDFPDGRIRKKGDLLRVREFMAKGKTPKTEFVYKCRKGVKGGCKIFDETEIELEGGDVFKCLCAMLKKMGLKMPIYYEKKRTLFSYKKWKFEIDEHPKIPVFMEIEGGNPNEVKDAVKLLGLEDYESTCETISELLARQYPKLKLNGLVF